MQKLPILRVFNDALDVVWQNRKVLFIALLPTVVAYYLIATLAGYLTPNSNEFSFSNVVFSYLWILLYIPVYTVFAVTVHRVVLLGHQSIPWYGQFPFTKREIQFGVYVLGAWILFFIIFSFSGNIILSVINGLNFSELVVSGGFIGAMIHLSFLVPAGYVLSRVSLGFPAIAIDNYFGWKSIWSISKGNSFRLFFCVSAIPWMFGKLTEYLPGGVHLIIGIFYSFSLFVMFAVEIAILSVCYKYLVQINEPISGD